LILIWALIDSFSSPKIQPRKTYRAREYKAPIRKVYSSKKVKIKKSSNKRTYSESKAKTNKDILLEAISANRNVSFRYIDKSDQVTFREVTPKKVFWYEFGEEGRMECLDAHCFLRNESRTFALFRISNLSIK
jgi:predicted DNA-binding transcriptional regulator YafY